MVGNTEQHRWLKTFDMQIRPIRRVLASLDLQDASSNYAHANILRLIAMVDLDDVPDTVAACLDDMVAAVEEAAVGATPGAYGTAWQLLGQLDRTLGLPLDVRGKLRRRGPPSLVQQDIEVSVEAPVESPQRIRLPAPSESSRRAAPSQGLDASLDTVLVDQAAVQRLGELGISSLGALWMRRPTRVDVIAPVHGAGRDIPEGEVAVGGRVLGRISRIDGEGAVTSEIYLQGADRARVLLRDPLDEGSLKQVSVGTKVVCAATAERSDDVVSLRDGRPVTVDQGRGYELHYAESSRDHALIQSALAQAADLMSRVTDPLPSSWLSRLSLGALASVLVKLHTTGESGPDVAKRLAFTEYLAAQLGDLAPRYQGAPERGITHACAQKHIGELHARGLATLLSDNAQLALEDVKRDLLDPAPMQRLIFGDGGWEIDAVALHAAIMVVEGRSQVLVVSPDAMTATVRFEQWRLVLEGLGYSVQLLGGAPRRADQEAIRRGDTLVVFGAPTVLELDVEWRRLGLVVIDEQGVYGASGKAISKFRAPRPDVLVLSRSPLPWSCLRGAYRQFSHSLVSKNDDGCAPVRPWAAAVRDEAYRALAEHVATGGSVLVAFPLSLGGTDVMPLSDAKTLLVTLSEQVFGGATVALFHGAMNSEQREQAIRDFEECRAQVLVSTTTIEMMPPMPRGVVCLVEHADRVDVQRLMALRSLITSDGMLHLVHGHEPREMGVRFADALSAGQRTDEIVPDFSQAFVLDEEQDAVAPLTWQWGQPDRDLALILEARRVAHAVLSSSSAVRSKEWTGVLSLAAVSWTQLSDDACPIPRPKPRTNSSRRRKRRRRRR